MKLNTQRPYSLNEIRDLFNLFLETRNLSLYLLQHKRCDHSYRPKKGSFKELCVILNLPSEANCSICFMQDHRPFQTAFQDSREGPKTIQQLNSLVEFYTWLYRHID